MKRRSRQDSYSSPYSSSAASPLDNTTNNIQTNDSVISMSTTPGNASQRRELDSLNPQDAPLLSNNSNNSNSLPTTPALQPQQQPRGGAIPNAEENSLFYKLVKKPIADGIDYITSFSFVGLLISYSALTCFFFALVLLVMQPPTKLRKVYHYTEYTNLSTSTTAAPHQQNSENSASSSSSESNIFYPVENPSQVLETLRQLREEQQQHFVADGELQKLILQTPSRKRASRFYYNSDDASSTSSSSSSASTFRIVGANPSHHPAYASPSLLHSAPVDEEDFTNLIMSDISPQQQQATGVPSSNSSNMTYTLEKVSPINFINAVYMSVTSFSASGLSSINYAIWSVGPMAVLVVIMTSGDIVLLTMLPALIRYRALSKEREKLVRILTLTGAYDTSDEEDDDEGYENGSKSHVGLPEDDVRSENSEYYDETIGLYVNRTEYLKTHPHAAHQFAAQQRKSGGSKQNKGGSQHLQNAGNDSNNAISTSASSQGAVHSQGILPTNSSNAPHHMNINQSQQKGGAGGNESARHSGAVRSAADARRRATMILNYDAKHTPHDNKTNVSQKVKKPKPGAHDIITSPRGGKNNDGESPQAPLSPTSPTNNNTTMNGIDSETASPIFPSASAETAQMMTKDGSSAFASAASIMKKEESTTASTAMYGSASEQHQADLLVAAAAKKQKEEDDEEARRAAEVAAELTFGKRIVYEDGLAHVNQQIDICIIIMGGVFFYWAFNHIFFTLMCMAGGKTVGWGFFHVVSAFNNAGLALSPDNMLPIDNDIWLMFIFVVVMPLGNTLFPVFFRFQMSLLHRLIRRITSFRNGKYARSQVAGQPLIVWQHSVRLFLRYPRKYYTHMFSKRNTLILFLLWLAATVIGMLLYIPEFGNPALFPEGANWWRQFWIAMFQTVSVRTTGFSIMNLDDVTTGHLAWWILAMYTSAYPFIITVRATANEMADEDDEASAEDLRREATSVVGRDLFWLYLAVMLIAYGEHAGVQSADHYDYSLFLRICFEVSSAFGNVGLSLPLPGAVYSYSGSMSLFSIWVMIAVMFCGKHRNLPRTVDEAIAIRVRSYDFSAKEYDPDLEASGGLHLGASSTVHGGDQNDNESVWSKHSVAGFSDANNNTAPANNNTQQQQPEPINSGQKYQDDDFLLVDRQGRRLRQDDVARKPHQLQDLPRTAVTNTSFLDANNAMGTGSRFDLATAEEDANQNSNQQLLTVNSGEQHQVNDDDDDQQPLISPTSSPAEPQSTTLRASKLQRMDSRRSSNAGFPGFPGRRKSVSQENNNNARGDGGADVDSVAAVANNNQQTFSFYLNEKGEVVRLSARELFERRVRAFYEHYNPARLPHLDRIVSAFENNPQALLKNLASTYGPEPGHARALSAEAALARINALKGKGDNNNDNSTNNKETRRSSVSRR